MRRHYRANKNNIALKYLPLIKVPPPLDAKGHIVSILIIHRRPLTVSISDVNRHTRVCCVQTDKYRHQYAETDASSLVGSSSLDGRT